jgi:hypothetical protein
MLLLDKVPFVRRRGNNSYETCTKTYNFSMKSGMYKKKKKKEKYIDFNSMCILVQPTLQRK